MKRIYLMMVLFSACFLASCEKDDAPVLDNPDERLNQVLSEYKTTLVSASSGWKGIVYPAGGGAYAFYLQFSEDDRVTMLSDFNMGTAATAHSSTYRLKALQRPTLIFDTYSYIHYLSDPDEKVNGGTRGAGLKSDFEFAIKEATDNTIKLVGTFNKSEMILVKATEAEAAAYQSGELKNIIQNSSEAVKGKFLYLMLGEEKVPVIISVASKTLTLMYVDSNNKIAQMNAPFTFESDGLLLREPVTYNGHTFSKVFWDVQSQQFYVKLNNEQLYFSVSPNPIEMAVNPPLHTVLGQSFTSMQINVANLPDLSADFRNIYNTANASLGTLGGAGRYIEYITLLFNANNSVTFQIRYRNPSVPNSFYLANFEYKMTLNANGVATFALAAAPAGNANSIKNNVVALTNYFANNPFKISYISASAPTGSTVGGFINQNNPESYFYGVLIQ